MGAREVLGDLSGEDEVVIMERRGLVAAEVAIGEARGLVAAEVVNAEVMIKELARVELDHAELALSLDPLPLQGRPGDNLGALAKSSILCTWTPKRRKSAPPPEFSLLLSPEVPSCAFGASGARGDPKAK